MILASLKEKKKTNDKIMQDYERIKTFIQDNTNNVNSLTVKNGELVEICKVIKDENTKAKKGNL